MANVPKVAQKIEKAHATSIWALKWTSDNRIITGSLDGTVHLWEFVGDELKCIARTGPQKVGVVSVAPTHAGDSVVVSYQNSTIRIFELPTLREASVIEPGIAEAWAVSVHPEDAVVAAGTHRGSINTWSLREGHEKLATLEAHNKLILNLAFNQQQKLACCSVDGLVTVFDVQTQQIVFKNQAHAMAARSIAFSPDGHLIYTASDDRHVSVFDTVSGSVVNSFSQSGMAYSVDTSSDFRHFVVGCADHTVAYWDLGMQRRVHTFDTHKDAVWAVGCNKGTGGTGANRNKLFASVGDDALLQLYA